ncbi:hypothetical protein J7F01_06300 [Streptomyces sp. ISL-22]|uniref:hypothetical protein n=1 Tax=unclassified Streptomyces TaxID=2593676 RepID=UPI001BECD3A7|nr:MULTISPECIES: hypothetical protein [unclassified Streptomyces]MBT2419749.1 hypothetical protein [Streptomyces sp. ISL-24]MBT2431815.1 hypothetical protein [Streptomyces sp. ISL-22]
MSSAAPALGLSLLVLLGAAPTATAADGWSVMPSGGGRPSFYGEGSPGTVLEDSVSVTNRSGAPVTVRLHAPGVTFADGTVRVPARTRADVPFTVTVPAADRTVEIVARDTDGRDRRVGLRLRADFPELSALTVEHVAVRGDGIAYELVNRGTTAITPRLSVRADGLFGRLLDRAPRTLPVDLPPGSRTKLTEPWPGRPALDAVEVRLTVTAAGGARDTAEASARFVPWGAVAWAAAAVSAAGALFVVRRLRRRGPYDGEVAASAERPYAEAELTGART